jgi:ubiquinone/menaquinone biosynthesis C-methylase UbiE
MGSNMPEEKRPPVCDYEGSDYQARFWEKGGREYEDRCEAIALKHLLPRGGKRMLELGAGAGRNTPRYAGFERVVLLDYSRTQLRQAQEKLGRSERYVYVAANIYRLPFADGLFDSATMIRTLHHMSDAQAALKQVRDTLQPGATFILEFANKRNIKAILRYALRRQTWNPFTPGQVEFAPLNFDFQPRSVFSWLTDLGFQIEKIRTVSHFRVGFLKRTVPAAILASLDALLQWTGSFFQYSPSIFVRASLPGEIARTSRDDILSYFKCPNCGGAPLQKSTEYLSCPSCGSRWPVEDGIYNFKD